jgi:hypothetical protein
MTEQKNITRNMALYWEVILTQEMAKASLILERKQKRLDYLYALPFEQKTEVNQKTIKALEEELSAFLGLILTIDKLKDAYIETTAAMADTLRLCIIKRDFYYQELVSRGGTTV